MAQDAENARILAHARRAGIVLGEARAQRLERLGDDAERGLEGVGGFLGREAQRDYWGNVIPGRDDVKPGSKGSKALVVKTNGRAWAKKLEAI